MQDNVIICRTHSIETDGSVTIQGKGWQERWRPWGHPDGFGVDGCKECPDTGAKQPLLLTHILGDRLSGPLVHIRDSIPVDVRAAVTRLVTFTVELLQLAELAPAEFCGLAKKNPALCLAMASTRASSPMLPLDDLVRHIRDRKAHRAFGARFSRRSANVLSKLHPNACFIGHIQTLLRVLYTEAHASRLLSHVKTVTLDTNTLWHNHPDVCRLNPSLLHCAAESPPFDIPTADNVSIIMQCRAKAGLHPLWPHTQRLTPERLSILAAKAVAKAPNVASADVPYPPPPVSPCSEWGWASCKADLEWLGEHFQNCAVSRHALCAMGMEVIYFERNSEPYPTVVVLQKQGRNWRVTDVLSRKNEPVAAEVELACRLRFTEMANEEGGEA